MIKRLVGALAVAVLALSGCGSNNSGLPGDTRCGHSVNGVVCVVVLKADGPAVGDVIGYYSPAVSLTGRTWRLDLVRYNCDPATRRTCRPAAQYPSATRHVPPPVDGSCIAVLYDSGRPNCTTRLAEEMATHDDWAGLPRLPSTALGAHTWLCVSAQLARGDGWHDEFGRSAACYH
jgi:hypothetical protein